MQLQQHSRGSMKDTECCEPFRHGIFALTATCVSKHWVPMLAAWLIPCLCKEMLAYTGVHKQQRHGIAVMQAAGCLLIATQYCHPASYHCANHRE